MSGDRRGNPQPLPHTEALMQFPTRLFLAALVTGFPGRAVLSAQATLAASVDTPASVRWNRLVPGFADQAAARRQAARAAAASDSAAVRRIGQTPLPMPFQVYTALSIAQYGAVNSAMRNGGISSDAAVAGASAAVLAEMYTDSAVRASIARELARDLERGSHASEQTNASRLLGEDVARRVIAWAPTYSFVSPWNGPMPTGRGMWYSARGVPPLGIAVGKSRPWVMDSASQFRPGPPPAYGSPAFLAALEEVRRFGRERTPEQTKIAQRWNAGDPWTLWNETAAAALRRNRASNAEAARVLAVLNVAASDAVIACFDAKYHYWTIRPSQEDTILVLADSVGLPNFPAYPSGHACSAGAFGAVLGYYFPQERADITRLAEEQAMSRLYGGIHYRFDNDGGLALGRVVGLYIVDRERRGGLDKWRQANVSGTGR